MSKCNCLTSCLKIILLSKKLPERNWLLDVSAGDLKAMIHQKVKGRSMCHRPKDRKSRYLYNFRNME